MTDTQEPKTKNNALFISSDPDHRFSVKTMLEELGCEVHCSTTRARARQLLSVIQFSAVIADLEIPKTTGIDLCKIIRTDKKFKSLPIIVVGEDDDEGTKCIAAFEAGADEFISAPFKDKVFLARVKRFLSQNVTLKNKSYLSVEVSSGDLPGILQYLEAEIKTGKLNIKKSDDCNAVLYLKDGRLVNATAPYCTELDAVTEVLSWDSSLVTFNETELNENEIAYTYELTGTVMNCVVGVDEYREVQAALPGDDVMIGAGSNRLPDNCDDGKKRVYELALRGFGVSDIIESQKESPRRVTLWIHELLEEEYLKAGDRPFARYTPTTYAAYKGSQIYRKRFQDATAFLKGLTFPLTEVATSGQFSETDWLAPAPKIVVTGDNFDHASLFVQSLSVLATSLSKIKPLVKKHRKGVVTTRLFYNEKEIIDIQQLPPAFDKLILNTLNDYLGDAYAVIYLVSAQDRKTTRANLRLLRLLRQCFNGVYYFIVPQVPNPEGTCEFRIDCTHCQYKLAVDLGMAGATGECPICKTSLIIPDCLDHLAQVLQLPDDVPIAELQPHIAIHSRELQVMVHEAILHACNPPPEPVEEMPEEVSPEELAEANEIQSEVPAPVHARVESQRTDATDSETAVEEPQSEHPVDTRNERQEIIEEQPQADSVLDQILSADDDQFDIDEFIKSVKKVK